MPAEPSQRARGMSALVKRSVLNFGLRLTFKPVWARKDLSVELLRMRIQRASVWLPGAKSQPTKLERISPNCEGEWIDPPGGTSRRVLLYLHGGAWMVHAPVIYRDFAHRLATALDARVFLPDYRLAPENRFPAGVDDALDAYRHLLARGIPPSQIVIGGDSAGGNLTLVTLLRARDEGLPLPSCAFLLSPVTQMQAGAHAAHTIFDSDVMFSPAAIAFVTGQYLGDASLAAHPWVSPALAPLHGLPPMLFQASDAEALHDDSRTAVERINAQGGQARLSSWHGLPHVFQLVAFLDESKAAVAELAAFCRSHDNNTRETT